VPRLEFRIERLRSSYRFTYAFHAREVRFERDTGAGWERVFSETFSFHAGRHDPAELYLRIEDLWTNPGHLAPGANRRDAEELSLRWLSALPGHLESTLDRLKAGSDAAPYLRACEDVAVFGHVVLRFTGDKGLSDHPRLRLPCLHLRKLILRALLLLVEERVSPAFLDGYAHGRVEPERSGDPNDLSYFYALAGSDLDVIDRRLVGAAERAYHRWLEDICLVEDNRAFESENSPFAEREVEVLRTVCHFGDGPVTRGGDLSPFLVRPGSRDCLRLLKKLETWFLRQYDVHHAAAVLNHADNLRRGRDDADLVLSRHSTPFYVTALLGGALPFLLAIFAYDRAPRLFDWVVSIEVAVVTTAATWFLAYRFMWKKDLSLFHASVPRIGAGIIVGYLPVFMIDEVWDLAEQSVFYLLVVIAMLGSTTLLYIYVEVQRRLGDPGESFSRALGIFLLGLVEAAGFGLVVTSLLGPLMAVRNWGNDGGAQTFASLQEVLTPFVGELPRIVGLEPFSAFPTAVLLMSFLAFFIGTFLQLLWEDLPITEPL
jgi:hypothetical protein